MAPIKSKSTFMAFHGYLRLLRKPLGLRTHTLYALLCVGGATFRVFLVGDGRWYQWYTNRFPRRLFVTLRSRLLD